MACRSTPAHSAMFSLSRFAALDLDDTQRSSIFHSIRRSASKWDPAPVAPDAQTWRTWLAETKERVRLDERLPERMRGRVMARLDQSMRLAPPSAADFAALQNLEKRCSRVKYAMKEQATLIGSWYGVSSEEVLRNVKNAREEYLALPVSRRPTVPPQYVKGFRFTAPNVPKDDATIYSFYAAEDPSLYDNRAKTLERYVALDLETTGISTKDSHIIEIGCVFYDKDGQETGRWSTMVRPPAQEDGTYNTGPIEVHGIKPEDVANAPTFEEVIPTLQAKLQGHCMIGHNLAFDTRHLRTNLDRHAAPGEKYQYPWRGEVDTYIQAVRHMDDVENHKLVTISAKYGVPYTNGHRAEHDAAVSGEVFFKMRDNILKTIKTAE